MESTLREYAYLEPGPSCTGYTAENEPLFDCGIAEGYQSCAEKLQQGALDFVREFLDCFWGYEAESACRPLSGAIPFEAFLRHCSEADREMFAGVLMDDELWGGRRDIDLKELMEIRLSKLPAYAKEAQPVSGPLQERRKETCGEAALPASGQEEGGAGKKMPPVSEKK